MELEIPLELLCQLSVIRREAWTLGTLISKTRNPKTKMRVTRCRARLFRFEKQHYRWLFRVSCRESYSAAYQVARFRVDVRPGQKLTPVTSRANVLVSCSCPAWLYWGSAYRSTQNRYNDLRPENRPPVIRDPRGLNWLCKHIMTAAPLFYGFTVPIPEDQLEKGYGDLPPDLNQQVNEV